MCSTSMQQHIITIPDNNQIRSKQGRFQVCFKQGTFQKKTSLWFHYQSCIIMMQQSTLEFTVITELTAQINMAIT
jgi:hypothetical protein